MPTKIYSYSCRIKDSLEKERITKQLRMAFEYYNARIAMVRRRWKEYDEMRKNFSGKLTELHEVLTAQQAVLADALANLQTTKVQLRSKIGGKPEREAVTAQKNLIRDTYRQIREEKERLKESGVLATASTELTARYNEEAKQLYARYPELFWGTKNAVAADVESAEKKSKTGPPEFKVWSRNGRLFCQVMGGVAVPELYGDSCKQVQIERVKNPDGSLHRKHAIVRMRIGSRDGTKPLWADVKAVIHRPMPENGVITGVQLVRREGVYYRFKHPTNPNGVWLPVDDFFIQFVVKTPDELPNQGAESCVAVDVGWRMRPDRELRVAAWIANTGERGEFTLPEEVWARWFKANALRSQRDINFNEMRTTLLEWLSLHVHPEWLKKELEYLPQWRSIKRLHVVLSKWEPFDGDEAIHTALRTWQAQDQHLNQWERNNVRKADRIRKGLYRKFARQLERRFGFVILEKINLAEMKKNPDKESTAQVESINTYRNVAAAGLMTSCLKYAFGTPRTTTIDPAGTTFVCSACDQVCEWDRSKLNHVCEHCGAAWDQDFNAAMNLLKWAEQKRAMELAEAARNVGVPPSEEAVVVRPAASKWQRRKAVRTQKAE